MLPVRKSLSLVFMLFFPLVVWGQMEPMDKGMKEGDAFRVEYLQQLKTVEEKIVGLAEAIPAEKYSWRPMEGVRSVSEVFAHIAGGNFMLPSMAGVKVPEDIDRKSNRLCETCLLRASLRGRQPG